MHVGVVHAQSGGQLLGEGRFHVVEAGTGPGHLLRAVCVGHEDALALDQYGNLEASHCAVAAHPDWGLDRSEESTGALRDF